MRKNTSSWGFLGAQPIKLLLWLGSWSQGPPGSAGSLLVPSAPLCSHASIFSLCQILKTKTKTNLILKHPGRKRKTNLGVEFTPLMRAARPAVTLVGVRIARS